MGVRSILSPYHVGKNHYYHPNPKSTNLQYFHEKIVFFFPRSLRFQGFWDPMVYQLNLLNPFHWIRFQKKYSDAWETSVDELGLQETILYALLVGDFNHLEK